MTQLSPGRYRARPLSKKIGPSTNKGTPQVTVELEILPSGQIMTFYGSLHANALEITVRQLRALGLKGNNLAEFQLVEEVRASLGIERNPQTGRDQLRIKNIDAGGADADEYTAEDFDHLCSDMQDKIAAIPQRRGNGRTNQSDPGGPEFDPNAYNQP